MTGLLHKPNDVVGNRYEVIDYIGEGGMQEVYSARDHLLNRMIALKSPKGASARKRFQRSAVVSAKVNHPNIAKTLDYFDEGDRQYLVEELVEGCNLAEFLRDHVPALDPYSVAMIFHRLAQGLRASHHVNVAHRDMKPSNVMVQGGKDFLNVKITDFGIAKLAEAEIGEAAEGGGDSLTASATALGALPYMAPEMIDDFKSAGKPADVWALGAMTFELLTGKKPFGDGYRAVKAIEAGVLPPLPQEIIGNTQFRNLIGEIMDLVQKCIIKDISLRISSDELASLCSQLCYSDAKRHFGVVSTLDYEKYGFIQPENGLPVFYHRNSTYNMPNLAVGTKVWYSHFPGTPRNRAFPVVAARQRQP
ncbi:serine/threonine-protein kinase [uncultured Sphingomonas sp.]|uniref:serine/threonine-protein kinase n=1 Tax=uncultured Sphingomonas sp. TaxID=158754 RepID=UPI0025DD0613|nr:serine/threonine-protein kinase [uncultured Sphingomonas sp.]